MEGTTPNMKIKEDKFWYEDPCVLFDRDRLTSFIPHSNQTKNEILNSLARLFIYVAILSSMYSNNLRYMLIAIVGLILTFLIFNVKEDFILEPTLENPFMNRLATDPLDVKQPDYLHKNTKHASDVKRDMINKFNQYFRINAEEGDKHDKYQYYQFFTVPNSLDDYEKFQNFLGLELKNKTHKKTYYSDPKEEKTSIFINEINKK